MVSGRTAAACEVLPPKLVQYCLQHSWVVAVKLCLHTFSQSLCSASIQQYQHDGKNAFILLVKSDTYLGSSVSSTETHIYIYMCVFVCVCYLMPKPTFQKNYSGAILTIAEGTRVFITSYPPKSSSFKVNVTAWLEIELTYHVVAIKHVELSPDR